MTCTSRRVASTILGLLIVEGLLRILIPLPELANFNRAYYMPQGESPVRTAKTVCNMSLIWRSGLDNATFVHHLNAYGFRDMLWRTHRTPAIKRVAFVGDSFVEGFMAHDDDTIPRHFTRTATAAGVELESMNLGVGGAGLAEELKLILDSVPAFRPDGVVLCLYANDLPPPAMRLTPTRLKKLNPWQPRLWTLIRLWRAKAMLPLRGFRHSQTFLTAVPDSLNRCSDPAFVAKVEPMVDADVLEAMRQGTFNCLRVGGSTYLEKSLRDPLDLGNVLVLIKQFVEHHGGRLAVTYLPDRGQVTTYYQQFEARFSRGLPKMDLTTDIYQGHARALTEICGSAGIPFLDLTPILRRGELAGHHLYWDYDDHLRGAGYRVVGESIFHWLRTTWDPILR